MLYNTTYKFTKQIAEPSQEEIYNCPGYFGMSYEQVKQSNPPEFLIKLLDQFPWDGRRSILQIRPQDFRKGRPNVDGTFWHCDDNVRLIGSTPRCSTIDEFHLMVISWGDMCSTEFMKTILDMPNHLIDPVGSDSHLRWELANKQIEVEAAPSGQMVEYTSRDLHRASLNNKTGAMRLMIVGFNHSSDFDGNIRIQSSIREGGGLKFVDQ